MLRGRGREANKERGWRERTSESGDELTRLDFKPQRHKGAENFML